MCDSRIYWEDQLNQGSLTFPPLIPSTAATALFHYTIRRLEREMSTFSRPDIYIAADKQGRSIPLYARLLFPELLCHYAFHCSFFSPQFPTARSYSSVFDIRRLNPFTILQQHMCWDWEGISDVKIISVCPDGDDDTWIDILQELLFYIGYMMGGSPTPATICIYISILCFLLYYSLGLWVCDVIYTFFSPLYTVVLI